MSIFEKGEWRDLAHIKMYFPKTKQEFSGYTNHIVMPTECVNQARKLGFDKHIVADALIQIYPTIDLGDPHLFLTGKSRVYFLSETIEKLVRQADSLSLFHRMS